MNGGGLDWTIVLPAMLAGVLVLITHVPLGRRVLARGIVFIDLAIAQIAALGVIAADTAGWEPLGVRTQIVAVLAASAGGAFLTFTEKRWPEVQEALIGVVFVLAASISLLLLANNPHGGEHLQDLLAGQILWVGYSQLWPFALLTVLVAALLWWASERLSRLAFYLLFAVTVTASVQVIGVYLVFASLIVPALSVRAWPARWQGAAAYGLGVLGYLSGLLLSMRWDLPAGSLIVLCLAVLGILAATSSLGFKTARG